MGLNQTFHMICLSSEHMMSDAILFLVIGVLLFMFAGEPDLHDAVIEWIRRQ